MDENAEGSRENCGELANMHSAEFPRAPGGGASRSADERGVTPARADRPPFPGDAGAELERIVLDAKEYERTSLRYTGSFGEVRLYVNLASGTAIAVKKFFGQPRRRVAQFCVERAARRELLRVGEPAVSAVARVLGFAGTEKNPVVALERLESTFEDEVHGGRMTAARAYGQGVGLLDAVDAGNLAYLDATFSNAGFRAGRAKLVDLGAFYVRHHGTQRLTPSYVPPFMWRTNLDTGKCFCSTDGRMYSLPEMRCAGYYALLCSALAVYLGAQGVSHEEAFFPHTTHLAAWFVEHGFGALDEAVARYKELLAQIEAPEARPLLEAIDVFLSGDAEDAAMLNVARVAAARVLARPPVRRKVAWKSANPPQVDASAF